MPQGKILSIDDDEGLQTVIEHYLEGEGYTVLKANDLKTALEKVETTDLDVILLDLVLPDGEGHTIIPQFQSKSKAGIIVVSGKSDTTEKIICLEMGADDYMTKPFEMRELAARIKATVRRLAAKNQNEPKQSLKKAEKISFEEGWTLDRSSYQLFKPDETSADLTTGEFKLLEALTMAPGRALSREHLFDLTRDGEFDAYDRAIDIQIGRLRKKIEDKDGNIIKTVRGVGYMFAGKIQD